MTFKTYEKPEVVTLLHKAEYVGPAPFGA
jgi:hypothetical protein